MQNSILKQSHGLIIFLPLAFVLAGLIELFVFADQQALKEKNCTQETTGIVTDISIKKEYSGTGSKRWSKQYYVGDVEYTVNNKQYTRYIKTKQRLREEQKVDVLYNSADPSEVILPKYDMSSGMLRIFGMVFIGIGVFVFGLTFIPFHTK